MGKRLFILFGLISMLACTKTESKKISLHSSLVELHMLNNGESLSFKSTRIDSTDYISAFKVPGMVVLYDLIKGDSFVFAMPSISANDSLGQFYSYHVVNLDMIVYSFEHGMLFSNRQGNIKKKHKLINPYLGRDNHAIYVGSFNNEFRPFMIHNGFAVVPINPLDINYWDFSFYTHNILGTYNFKTGELFELPLYYPNRYQQKLYGNANRVVYTQLGSDVFYCTYSSDTLYQYNMVSGKQRSVAPHNKHFTFKCDTFNPQNKGSMSKIFDHLTSNDLTIKLIEDNTNQVIYQLIWLNQPIQNADGTFNSIRDKKVGVNIFSTDGTHLKYHPISEDVLWQNSLVYNGKLLLKLKNENQYLSLDFFYRDL